MPYWSSEPRFEILANSVWWKVSDLQDFLKESRLIDAFNYLEIMNENWRQNYLKQSYKYNSSPPFSKEARFGTDKGDDAPYICEAVEEWGSALTQLRAALLIKDDRSAFVKIMMAVNFMESKLSKLEGVFNREKFEAKFEIFWS